MNKGMRYAGISGIFAVLLSLVGMGLNVLGLMGVSRTLVLDLSINILYLLFAVPFFYGLVLLGEKARNRVLVYSSYLSITVMVPGMLLSVFFSLYSVNEILTGMFGLALVVLSGLVSLVLGAALLKLKKTFGSIATAAGLLEIGYGVLSLTVILYYPGAFLGILAAVLEVILLFRASGRF